MLPISVMTAPAAKTVVITTATTTNTNTSAAVPAHLIQMQYNNRNATTLNKIMRLRKRHSKRHSNWYDELNFNENTTAVEWSNPCGGIYVPTNGVAGNRRIKRKNLMRVYNSLKRTADSEYKTLNESKQVINISNFELWDIHKNNYKFLAKLKMNSSIALKRWYRNMQTYVGSFAYLRRVQLKWDEKSQRLSDTARELKNLLLSSRRMLCELETAVNNTHPYQRNGNNLKQITRTEMNERLKYRTKLQKRVQEPNLIDLKFVKYYYYEFLLTMWELLPQMKKRHGQHKAFNEVSKTNFNRRNRDGRRGGGGSGSGSRVKGKARNGKRKRNQQRF